MMKYDFPIRLSHVNHHFYRLTWLNIVNFMWFNLIALKKQVKNY